ncbi:hypothetical protein JZ751_016814 [Albula glossodonta]|uniref:Liprin-beta-1/2 coiled-coil domain-containing protein n=1 Tax=Albula glossodonta TaxID=121402 RepID=A0A8T2NXR0_9TELE|nr:hypothetical protein JZ751_016814 [Albula glossodonta]
MCFPHTYHLLISEQWIVRGNFGTCCDSGSWEPGTLEMMSDASDMLAAALEQMDGSKALEYSNGLFDCQSPTSPFMGGLRALHLVEDLRGVLELMDPEERDSLRCQIPDSTAESLSEWLQGHLTNGHISLGGDVYQERLARLESDKESLVLQVSVLTDQVEAQGEKIRDLDLCLEEHREKLNATEDMLQQELLSRTALETQKLDLMAEVSNLKLKLTAVEKDRLDFDERFRDSEVQALHDSFISRSHHSALPFDQWLTMQRSQEPVRRILALLSRHVGGSSINEAAIVAPASLLTPESGLSPPHSHPFLFLFPHFNFSSARAAGLRPGQSPHSLALEFHDRIEFLETELSLFQEKRSQLGDQEGLIQEINELRYRVSEMENERMHYEKKLKSTKSLMAKLSSLKIKMGQMQYEKQRKENTILTLKEELATLKRQLEGRDGELKKLHEETHVRVGIPEGIESGDKGAGKGMVINNTTLSRGKEKEGEQEKRPLSFVNEAVLAAVWVTRCLCRPSDASEWLRFSVLALNVENGIKAFALVSHTPTIGFVFVSYALPFRVSHFCVECYSSVEKPLCWLDFSLCITKPQHLHQE